MALGTNHVGISEATGGTAGFVPEKWIDDVIVTYESNLTLGDKVKHVDFTGQKGDTINLPSLTTRGSVTAKAEDTAVTLVQRTDSEVVISLNKHYEYSFLIEDRVSIQAMAALANEYMSDAGYALSTQIDQDIWVAFATMQAGAQFSGGVIGSDGSTAWDGTANGNTGNAAALTDAGIRKVIQTLDDSDNPMMDRHLVIPPVERNNLMGLARFTEQAFIGNGSAIRNGIIGDIYGINVAVSTHCPYVHLDSGDGDDYFDFSSSAATTGTDITGTSVTIGAGGAANGRLAVMFQRDSVRFANQLDIRLQDQYKQEYLGTLHTADTLYGVTEARDYGAMPIFVAD